jgi:hypothetical protein
MHGRKEKFVQGNMREGVYMESSDLDGRIILKWIFEKWDGSLD